MVAGFEDLDEWEIEVGGELMSSKAKNFYVSSENMGFGMVFQTFAVWPHMTVWDNVGLSAEDKEAVVVRDNRAHKTGACKHESD